MENYYLVIFKKVAGQDFNNYSFVNAKTYKDLVKQNAVFHHIKAPKKEIYSKDDIRDLLAKSPNKKVNLDLD